MTKNWTVDSSNVLFKCVTKILVCNYRGLNKVCHFSFNLENKLLKMRTNSIGVWQIKKN